MRICLINPPQTSLTSKNELPPVFFPMGIAYIAAVLKMRKEDVTVIDAHAEGFDNVKINGNKYYSGLGYDEIESRIKAIDPHIVGLSIQFSFNERSALNLARFIKKMNPQIILILGGPHPTVRFDELLSNEDIDYIIIGEGEETIVDLIDALKYKKNVEEVKGIAFKKNNKIIRTGLRKNVANLDLIPFPAWELLPMENYFRAHKLKRSPIRYIMDSRYVSVITSRGCPYSCNFCSIHSTMGRKFRPRNPGMVITEIEYLKKKYGIKHVNFEDDNISLDLNRFKQICKLIIDHKLNITWSTPNGIRADKLDEDAVRLMKQSGCKRVFVAPESGVQRVLEEIIHKKMDLSKIEDAIRMFKKYKITVDASFVIGLPGETKDDIENTIRYAIKLKNLGVKYSGFNIATPLYGTDLYKEVISKGYLKKNVSSDLFSTNEAVIETPEYTADEILNYREMAELRVNYGLIKLLKGFVSNIGKPTKIKSALKRLIISQKFGSIHNTK